MSSLDTRSILGSIGRLSRSSCGFTRLLRFDDGVPKSVSCVGDERGAEGSKTWFATLSPVIDVGDAVSCGIVCSDLDTVLAGLASLEFECSDSCSVEIVRDAANVFEFIGHGFTIYR